ncbi:replication factor C subunit 3 [Trichonephila clavipes]|nr:replication factor C subunit 3 [Trichonephila clavipes]
MKSNCIYLAAGSCTIQSEGIGKGNSSDIVSNFKPPINNSQSLRQEELMQFGSRKVAQYCVEDISHRGTTLQTILKELTRPRSELIAIDEALRIIKTMTSPDEIWILCDSRSAIQHLSDWTNVGDKTSVSILKNLKELSQQHEIYFQWIPSHIGLFGNDTADLLAKEGVTENLMSRRTLTFSEIFSKTKSLIQELWKTPPTHPWYNRQAPGGALSIKADRVVQTTISRLASGYIRGLSLNLGQKIYENCTKCNLVQATPDHLLFCAGLEREDIYSSPLLVYDFLRTLWLMDLV